MLDNFAPRTSKSFSPSPSIFPPPLSSRGPFFFLLMAPCPKSPIKNRRAQWSPRKRALVRNSRLQGESFVNIGKKYNIPPTAARSLFHRWKNRSGTDTLSRSGRPPILTEHDKRHINRAIKANPFISNRELLSQCGLNCNMRTLTKWLKSQGVQHVSALRRPNLSPEDAAARLKTAQDPEPSQKAADKSSPPATPTETAKLVCRFLTCRTAKIHSSKADC